ncbi:hypothetical protein ALC62_08636, partial [Cyphomyrmex costatus]
RVKICSRLNSFATEIECVVINQITRKISAVTMDRRTSKLPSRIKLADPRFNMASDIDMLIGAELFWQLLCVRQIHAYFKHLTIQKTRLGWVLADRVDDDSSHQAIECAFQQATRCDTVIISSLFNIGEQQGRTDTLCHTVSCVSFVGRHSESSWKHNRHRQQEITIQSELWDIISNLYLTALIGRLVILCCMRLLCFQCYALSTHLSVIYNCTSRSIVFG